MNNNVVPFSPYKKLGEIRDTIDALLAYGIYYKDDNVRKFAERLHEQRRELDEAITGNQYQDSLKARRQ